MKIGITSQNFRTITGHAGKARRFMVFSCNENGEWEKNAPIEIPKEMSMHEFKGTDHPIDELDVLITASCGDGFQRKMIERGVHVIQTGETDPIVSVEKYITGLVLKPALPHTHQHHSEETEIDVDFAARYHAG